MGDAAQARRWLEWAENDEPTQPATKAAIAQAHATLALNDRLAALLERAMTAASPRVPKAQQDAADELAIATALARGGTEADDVVRFVQEELGTQLEEHQEQMLRRLVVAGMREHPVQAADRAWFEAQKRNAIDRGDPQGIRNNVDAINRLRDADRMTGEVPQAVWHDEFQPGATGWGEDTSQYADRPTGDERRWVSEAELEQVRATEAQIDPDVAASNARVRREERERRAMDRQVARGDVGVFGQMRQHDPEEDG